MISAALVGVCLLQALAHPAQPASKVLTAEEEKAQALLTAKRIYVESFGDDTESKTFQSMLVDAIGSTKRFIVTENREKADLLLKGAALEKTAQEMHALGSGTVVATAAGGGSSSVSGSANSAGGMISGSSHSGFRAQHMGISDSQALTETVNDARAAVRLVSKDGDVVWSTTQESKGAKYKGATADVAEKIVKQLLHDIEKLEHPRPVEAGDSTRVCRR